MTTAIIFLVIVTTGLVVVEKSALPSVLRALIISILWLLTIGRVWQAAYAQGLKDAEAAQKIKKMWGGKIDK